MSRIGQVAFEIDESIPVNEIHLRTWAWEKGKFVVKLHKIVNVAVAAAPQAQLNPNFCGCPYPYHGAQAEGTEPRCERCKLPILARGAVEGE